MLSSSIRRRGDLSARATTVAGDGAAPGRPSPLHFAAVFFPVAVVGDGDGAGFEGLGDEKAVKGIAVVVGEGLQAVEFFGFDVDLAEAVTLVELLLAQLTTCAHLE